MLWIMDMLQKRIILKTSSRLLTRMYSRAISLKQSQLMTKDQCILVDENDNQIGIASKFMCHRIPDGVRDPRLLPLHRAFSLFLFTAPHQFSNNSDYHSNYKLLLQQRSSSKATFPLIWSNTCCSHPLAASSEKGESIVEAMQRKLHDELGIPREYFNIEDFMFIGKIQYSAISSSLGHDKDAIVWGEHEIDHIYFVISKNNLIEEGILEANPEEIATCKYVTAEELFMALRNEPKTYSPWFRSIANDFFFLPNENKGGKIEWSEMIQQSILLLSRERLQYKGEIFAKIANVSHLLSSEIKRYPNPL